MRAPRRLLVPLLALALIALAAPVASLASGGGSAGDQQYTDPFAGSQTTTPQTTTHTVTSPPPAPAPAATAPAPTTPATPAPTASTTPPQTAAPTTLNRLPYTGYDGWVGAGFGITMIAGGLVLRRRARRA